MSRPYKTIDRKPKPQQTSWTLHLPPEILCRIFILSLSESPFYDKDIEEIDQDGDVSMASDTITSKYLTTPFTLGSVCRHWRHIAWREPMLWNHIYLVASPDKAEIQAHFLQECLLRSGELPLTLEFDCLDRRWSSESADDALPILAPAFRYSGRCQTFRTRLPPSCLLLPPEGSNIPDPRFSKLTSLSIVPRFIPNEDDDEELDTIDLFKHATGLQHLRIREIDFDTLTIPWSSLIKVTANTIWADDCIQVLRSAKNLELAEFENILFPRKEPRISKPIILPELQTLHLDLREIPTSRDLVLPNITAPKLKTLEYVTQDADEFPIHKFIAFMERSNCNLDELAILNPYMAAQELQTCLTKVAGSVTLLDLSLKSNLPGVPMVLFKASMEAFAAVFPKIQTCKIRGPNNVISPVFSGQP